MTEDICTRNNSHMFPIFAGRPSGPCHRCGKPAPVDPSSYEQGFRDALLTAWAALGACRGKHPNGYPDGDSFALEEFEKDLNIRIDQKNLDLWKLLALAVVDLDPKVYPEAQALRSMLRAPNGVLIDGAGRMLFLRLNGVEYETGVLALLEENKELARIVAGLLDEGKVPSPPA